MDKIDKIDRIIIQTLQQDARSSLKSISRETNLSIPAVRERIKKLEKLSYIVRFTTLLNHNKLNKNLTCFCMVMLKKHDPKYEELFLSFAKNNQDILECHCIAY